MHIPDEKYFRDKDIEPKDMYALINPSYTGIDKYGYSNEEEECFSVTNVIGTIERYEAIQVTYYEPNGARIMQKIEGFHARIL